MDKVYINDLKNEELTSKTKQPTQSLINSILNFSKSYRVERSKLIGEVELMLN